MTGLATAARLGPAPLGLDQTGVGLGMPLVEEEAQVLTIPGPRLLFGLIASDRPWILRVTESRTISPNPGIDRADGAP